ncbi:uncharacterized protein EDB91DRAFT_1243986 [Suillus paluster]|uniref:uncharacterized protein n=1 Tax=Suillus paluster TaxID=48578 RepID=UPI001B876583|nr:uncharacterized protein EDB91DRAFT_1243986 [Suillus paluster]KAG1750408.1 hypothetical protein EDB91DRAFT_1243986 [Suillus paluster]
MVQDLRDQAGLQVRHHMKIHIADKYSLNINPEDWGASALNAGTPEPDDYLHNPDPKRDLKNDKGHIFTPAQGMQT